MMGLEGKKKGKEQRTPSQGCANLKKQLFTKSKL